MFSMTNKLFASIKILQHGYCGVLATIVIFFGDRSAHKYTRVQLSANASNLSWQATSINSTNLLDGLLGSSHTGLETDDDWLGTNSR